MQAPDGDFTSLGDYEVRMLLHGAGYRIPIMGIPEGNSIIPFSTFTYITPINVTVTGIPSKYYGFEADILLFTPETINRNYGECGWGWEWGKIEESSTTFTLRGVIPGTYDILLCIIGNYDVHQAILSISSGIINSGTNTITFNQFIPIPPINITVTGIPSRFLGECVMFLEYPETWDEPGWGRETISGSSVTFAIFMLYNERGIYNVHLWLKTTEGGEYFIIRSRYITDGVVIPWSDF